MSRASPAPLLLCSSAPLLRVASAACQISLDRRVLHAHTESAPKAIYHEGRRAGAAQSANTMLLILIIFVIAFAGAAALVFAVYY